MTQCNHDKYRDGHCAQSYCRNYYSRCKRHAIGMFIDMREPCTLEVDPNFPDAELVKKVNDEFH